MADPFPVSGNIDPTSFPHLLVDLHRQGATGSLKVNGPVHPKALYFRGGRVLFGSSNDPRDQLGAILIESGKITREQLDEVNEKVGPGNPLAKVLAESGFVNQRELGDAARVKVERILSDVISWASGTFEFEDGVLPKGAVDLKLSTEKLLLAAVQRIAEREFALRHLGGDMTVVLEAAPDAEAALTDVRAEVWPLLERLDGERTLQDAVALTRLDELDAAKTACAMIFLGIVQRKDAASSELDLAEQALSGFGEQPVPDGVPDATPPPPAEPGAAPPIVPSEAAPSFAILDAEPAAEAPAEVPPEEPVGVLPEPETPAGPPPSEPEEPVGILPEPEAAPPPPSAEPTGFEFSEPQPSPPPFAAPSFPAPAPEPTMALPVEPQAPPEPAPPPPVEAPVPSFTVDAPPRKEADTVPGDRPVYTPPSEEPAPGPETPAAGPEISLAAPPPSAPAAEPPAPVPASSSPDSAARPTQEDLAALDALLNPSASGKAERTVDRPRHDKWEPQFRTGGPSATLGTSATSRRAAGRRTRGSRAPLFAGLAGLLVASVGAGYFLLGRPSEPTPSPESTRPTPASTPALSAPATVASAPSPTATATPPQAVAPTPAATAAAPAPVATPTPTPAPTPPPAAAPAPPPAAPAGDALALFRQGAFDQSAQAFASSLSAGAQGSYSIQVLAACSPDTIRKAAQNVSGNEIFILPVTLNGRACFRVCWGVFDGREAAQAGVDTLPDYFRQSGISPRISPLLELLP